MTVNASTFNVPLEALADRTVWLRNRLAMNVPGAATPTSGPTFPFLLPPHSMRNVDFDVTVGPYGLAQTSVAASGSVVVPLPRPPSGVISEIQAFVKGAPGHAGLPATMPLLEVYRQDLLGGTEVLVFSATDTSGSTAAYQAGHTIVITTDHTLVADEVYYLVFYGETGANALTSLLLTGFAIYWSPAP